MLSFAIRELRTTVGVVKPSRGVARDGVAVPVGVGAVKESLTTAPPANVIAAKNKIVASSSVFMFNQGNRTLPVSAGICDTSSTVRAIHCLYPASDRSNAKHRHATSRFDRL